MKNFKPLIHLHIIVFIFGFTAILGKLIQIDAVSIVWYRMLMAGCILYVMLKVKKINIPKSNKTILSFLSIGFIVAAHWITFFHAIKVSNVSVTLACLASTTLFTSILEPIIIKRKFFWIEAILGLFIIFGLYLIFTFEFQYKTGILFALLSALLAGIFTIINKKITTNHNAHTISFFEMLGGFVIISFYMFIIKPFNIQQLKLSPTDFILLLILASICTAYAFTAIVELMKKISAYAVVLAINLEPIYGVILAYLIFGSSEYMSTGFYLGALIIVACLFLYQPLMNKFHLKSLQTL